MVFRFLAGAQTRLVEANRARADFAALVGASFPAASTLFAEVNQRGLGLHPPDLPPRQRTSRLHQRRGEAGRVVTIEQKVPKDYRYADLSAAHLPRPNHSSAAVRESTLCGQKKER